MPGLSPVLNKKEVTPINRRDGPITTIIDDNNELINWGDNDV